MTSRAHELDYVELLEECDGWPAGTCGTVVAEEPDTALVEVATEDRVDAGGLPRRELFDDLLSAPYDALRVVEPARATTR
jgi:hypothetical protein